MSSLIEQEKHALRAEIKLQLKQLSSSEKLRASQIICEKLRSLLSYQNFRTITVFAPLKTEPDIWPVIEWLWQQNKTVVFPKVRNSSDGLDFFEIKNRDELIQKDSVIWEPDESISAKISPEHIDIALIPGLAFDHQGNRLGRSGGLYDQFLADQRFHGLTIGICFPHQVIEDIPTEAHDQLVNTVIF